MIDSLPPSVVAAAVPSGGAFLLHNLESIFAWLLTASWQASVLALAVLAIQRILGSRLNPRWRYALWLLVLLRLVLPVLPESALSLFQFAPAPPAPLITTVTEPWHPLFTGKPYPAPSNPAPTVIPNYPFSWFTLLTFLWLTGALVLLVLTWEANRRFARHVANSPEISHPDLLRLFADARAELGIRRSIRLIENSRVQSPAIMGLFHPTLLLPSNVREKFDPRELRFIFLHELAHLKRGDVIVQALIALLQILHWFNPVLWFAFRRMRIDREPATDALVLSRAGEAEKERYGLMLIKLLEHFNQRHSLPTLVGILEDKDQFKRRFTLIARFTRGAYAWSLLGVLLIGLLSVACLTKSKATETVVSPSLIMSSSTAATVASKPEIEIRFTLVEIDEKTYQQQTTAIDQAVKNGNISFLMNLHGASVVSSPSVTTQAGLKADISLGKELIQGDKSTPVTTLTATSVLGANGKVVPTVVRSQSVGPTKTLLGVDCEITPSISKDGTILLPTRYRIGYIEDYKSPDDFNTRTSATDEKLSIVDGKASGFFAGYENASNGNRYTYSLSAILNAPGRPIKTLPPLSPSPNRLALIVTARRVSPDAQVLPAIQKAHASAPAPDLNTQLLTAVQKGDAATAQKLIDQGADPKAVDKYGQTLLFDVGSPEVAELLIAHGVDPKIRDKSGITALSSLCLNGGKNTAGIARVLLQHGADPNSRDGQLKTTPIMGVRNGDTVDVLVQFGADLNAVDSEGDGALFWSTWQDVSALEALLRHGIAYNAQKDGPTLLLHAAWNGNLPLVTWFLAHGVDPNVPGIWFRNHGHPDMMLPMKAVAISGQPAAAKLLLEHGAKGDVATPLALQNHYSNIVKILWEHGTRNISELCYAISQNAPLGDLEKILQSGAPVDPPQDVVVTPLGEAAETDNFPAVQLLVQHGADVNKGSNPVPGHPEYRDTPLVLASERGQDQIVTFLLQHGAQPEPNAVGSAALAGIPNSFYIGHSHLPSKEHYEQVIQSLIDAGALKTVTPESAGHLLAQAMSPCWGDPDPVVLQKLLAAGLSPEVPMPNLAEIGEKPNSVIGYYRDCYQKYKDDPARGPQTAALKPLLDLLEAADTSAPKASTEIQTPTNRTIPVNPIGAATFQQAIDQDRDDFAKSLLDSGTKPSQSDFIYALKATRPKIVSLFWNHGLHGCSPMSFAISQGASGADVEAMLNAGAKAEPDEDAELSPLSVACAFGNSPAARVLLVHGANPNWIGKSREAISSPLWLAIGRRQPEIVQLLLDHGAIPGGADVDVALGDLSAEMKARAPAVFYQKSSECFRILVAHGALEKVPAYLKASLLWNACLQVQDLDIVKMLLAHGFRPTDNDGFGDTALSKVRDAVEGRNNWPASPQFKPFLDLLEAADTSAPKPDTSTQPPAPPAPPAIPPDSTLLLRAAQRGQLAIMQRLLDHGVDPNVPGEDINLVDLHRQNPPITDTTLPIDGAVAAGNEAAVKLLLDHGAKGSMKGALEKGHAGVAKLLWEHGARDCSELTYAISQDEPLGTLESLLDKEGTTDPPADPLITPLDEAALRGNIAAAQLLLQRGAKLPTDSTFKNPLFYAARAENPDMTSFLLKNGAKVDEVVFINAISCGCIVPGYPHKEGTAATIDILIQAGALKGISEDQAAGYLLAAFISANPATLRQLLSAGLSPASKRTEPPDLAGKTAVETARDDYARLGNFPDAQQRLKPLLDLLESAANPGHTDASPVPSTGTASPHLLEAAQTGNAVYNAEDEAYFKDALKKDRSMIADSRVKTSTLAADAQMLEAIRDGDVATVKDLLEHAVDPNQFDPDRFHSSPVYWAVYFDRPEILKLLFDHMAEGWSGPANKYPLDLARSTHPELVPILEDGMKHVRTVLTAQLKERLRSIHTDVPAFSNAPLAQVTQFLLDATAKAGYLERRVNIANLDVPTSTTFTIPAAKNITLWDAIQTFADANKLRFNVDDDGVGCITFYPPRDEAVMHLPATH